MALITSGHRHDNMSVVTTQQAPTTLECKHTSEKNCFPEGTPKFSHTRYSTLEGGVEQTFAPKGTPK